MKDTIKNAVNEYFAPLAWVKTKCKNLNQWNWIVGTLAVWFFVGGYKYGIWNSIDSVIMVGTFFLLGRASLDRELEIALNRAKEAIAKKTKK